MLQRALDLEDKSPSIHLLPPHEYLATLFSSLEGLDSHLHTSFAWLGYGTLVRTKLVKSFVDLLDDPGWKFGEGEKAMADNYFTILRNVRPEIWMDRGTPLGHAEAFTVGTEGDDRNWEYIVSLNGILMECSQLD